MKKFFAVLLAFALTFTVFTVVPSAAGTNPEYTLEFTETAPAVDGAISADEYGSPIVSWTVSDGAADGIFLDLYEIEDDPELSIDFYAAWTETDLYLAWEVHTTYDSRVPDYVESGFMYEYCCVQFVLTPGAPDNSVTKFQTAQWSGDYLEIGLCLRDDDYSDKVCWSQPAAVGGWLELSDWEFAGSRDGDEELSIYECRLPLNKLGIGAIGDGAQFGLTWAVGAQENYETAAKGLIEWQDAIVGGKNADNAAVMTMVGSGKEVPSNPIENDFRYKLVNGEAIVTEYTGDAETVIIPDTLDGYPVTGIGDFAFAYTSVTSVTIPEGVTYIGVGAFQDCYYLESVNIPEGVTALLGSTFAYCYSLQGITLPDSLRFIESYVFTNCFSLTDITIPENVTEIEEEAFFICGSLESITVAEGNPVYYAENNCLIEKPTGKLLLVLDRTSGVSVPEGVKSIASRAFSGCFSVRSVTIPASVTYIDPWAFDSCSSLTTIRVAEGNTVFYAESNCLIEKSTGKLLRGPNVREVKIPEGVTVIGECAFNYCTNLSSVTIPDGVKVIEDWAFAGCEKLKSVVIPDGVTSIGMEAFADCYALADVTIPGSVKTIGEFAFMNCSSLKSITIPASVTTMGGSAFRWCDALTDIYCEAEKRPNGWSKDWLLNCEAEVHWGHKDTPALTLGDLNGNGKIDSNDYLLLKRYCLGSIQLTDEQLAVADVNGNGKINGNDYMLVKRHVLGSYTIG